MSTISFPDLIAKKRDGLELTEKDIAVFVQAVATGSMADCQIGAMLMAMYLNNLSENEVVTLIREMNSGNTLNWLVEWSGKLVDKHSTGGVGDKVSLILAPALAAVNLKKDKMSTISFPDLIAKKRDGLELTEKDIAVFVQAVATGSMADCQIGAMLMAMYLKNLSENEVVTLIREIKNSGNTLNWPVEWSGKLVDKHSTGDVGDKVSLILAPALAAVNLKKDKMSTISFPDLIAKKRDGLELTEKDIAVFVQAVATGSMADCQIGAMLMSMYLNNLSENEVVTLIREMKNSGNTLNWPVEWSGKLVDKHSTGGVGDKVSLILAPALAAVNLKVPMISGRGLAHTGGTLDKLESIPGFNVSLTNEQMTRMLADVGCFIAGQTGDICPADKKMYSIRDVTSTIQHIGLIATSIVSKKAAENINVLVLDVKTGSGAFLKQEPQSLELAKCMVTCSQRLGITTVALITDMDSPLGNMVGNTLEVVESIRCLQGQGPADLLDMVLELGAHLLYAGKFVPTVQEGGNLLRSTIADGSALDKFCHMLKGQGVSADVADYLCDPQKDMWKILTPSKNTTQFQCHDGGYVKRIDAMDIAVVTHKLGGGRNLPGEPVNWAVGVQLLVAIGDKVQKGQAWVIVHHDSPIKDDVRDRLESALQISADPFKQRESRTLHVVS